MTVTARLALAAATDLDDAAISELVGDPSASVRRVVARRADLRRAHLEVLGRDHDTQVRRAVAGHAGAIDAVLRPLLDDPDFHVRWAAAQNRAASADLRLQSTASQQLDVRRALAELPWLELAAALQLAHDEAWRVREQLARQTDHQAVLEILLNDTRPSVRGAVAFNEAATRPMLESLLSDRDARARMTLAASDLTPIDLLMQLVNDRSADVRFWLTRQMPHPKLLEALTEDPDPVVASTARNSLRDRHRFVR